MSATYDRPAAGSNVLRLHLNENTNGCSPRVIDAVRLLTAMDAAFYPDYADAIRECAQHLGVAPDEILLTNGLDEGILAACVAHLRDPGGVCEAVIVTPAFDMYAIFAEAAGGRSVRVPPRPGFAFPLADTLRALTPATRLVFLTNPNNPTGLPIDPAAIREILAATENKAVVFLDEAYMDFSAGSFIEEFRRHPNLIVGRTFAKAYGLAGLRVGAVIATPDLLAPLRRVVPPYSVNAFAAAGLRAALSDPEYVRWYVEQVAASKALVYNACDRLGLHYWPSAANFVLVRVGPRATEIVALLAAAGIVVRNRTGEPGCEGCIRIAAGVVAHTQAALAALEDALCPTQ